VHSGEGRGGVVMCGPVACGSCNSEVGKPSQKGENTVGRVGNAGCGVGGKGSLGVVVHREENPAVKRWAAGEIPYA